MANKLNPKVVSLSLVVVSAILSVICAILLAIFPDATLRFFGSIFHGIDMTKIATSSVTISGVVTGLIAIVLIAFVTGWLFAIVFNYLQGKIRG